MDFVKLSEQRFTAKKFDVNKKIPRDDVEKLKTIQFFSSLLLPSTASLGSSFGAQATIPRNAFVRQLPTSTGTASTLAPTLS